MPIVYDDEHEGWYLKDATESEIKQIQEIGTAELVKGFSEMVMSKAVSTAMEEDEAFPIPEGATKQ